MVSPQKYQGRARTILHTLVETYIRTGEPVGSRSLSRMEGQSLSAATIRNVMADLYDEGYLAQPHTSAGRIPTAKAIQSYVQSLAPRKLSPNAMQRVQSELSRAGSVEQQLELSSHLLTEMTSQMGIAAAIPSLSQTLVKIELVLLADRRVLMVVETTDRHVAQHVVSLEQNVSQDELNSIRNYVNQQFSGWSLPKIQAELNTRLAEERAAYDALLRKLELLYQKGLLRHGPAADLRVDGLANLLVADLHLTRERLRDLVRTLEEKERLLQLLDGYLEQMNQPSPLGNGFANGLANGLTVQVGLGDAHPAMEDLSLIGINLVLPGGMHTRLAVLGPIRMNYSQALSVVTNLGEVMQKSSS